MSVASGSQDSAVLTTFNGGRDAMKEVVDVRERP